MQTRQNADDQVQIENDSQTFWHAAYTGDIKTLKSLLENKRVSIDFVLNDVTPLFIAAYVGHTEIVEELLKYNPNINFKHVKGVKAQSVLWVAAERGYTKIVALLLQHDAFINEVCNDCSPLWIAVQNNHLDTVKELIKYNCDVNLPHPELFGPTALYEAVYSGRVPIIEALIQANADVNYPGKDGTTLLHLACAKGFVEIVATLIEAGANVNAKDLFGSSSLDCVADSDIRLRLFELFLKNGYLLNTETLSQPKLNCMFSKYLDFYTTLHPDKYTTNELVKIKEQLKHGLCHGYVKLRRLMRDRGLDNTLNRQFNLMLTWDLSFEMLQTNQELESALDKLLFNLFALHMSNFLNGSCIEGINLKYSDLIDLDNSYEEIFIFGLVFKYDELEGLFRTILKDNVTIDIFRHVKDTGHAILITKLVKDEYELFDSNQNVIKHIKVFSLKDLIDLLKQVLEANSACIGFGMEINMISPSCKEKREYTQIKNTFLASLLETRAVTNEIALADAQDSTSLYYALFVRDTDTAMKLLTTSSAVFTEKELLKSICMATQIGSYEIVKKLLEKGCDVNSELNGFTILHNATSSGNIKLVELLINEKANINLSSKTGSTALAYAAENGHTEVTKLLIQSGADINKETNYNFTPLGLAIKEGFLDVVKILVEFGADCSKVFLHYSALELAKRLLQANIINYLNAQSGNSPNLLSTRIYVDEAKKNSFIFFKHSKKRQSLIENRHTSYEAQNEYDKHYGLINFNK